MIKKNSIKKLSLAGLTISLLALCAVWIAFAGVGKSATAAVELKENISFRDTYVVGQTLEIPDATILVNGEALPTDKAVCYPNGSVYKTNSVLFKDNGAYTLEYRAKKDGVLYTKTFSFKAEKPLFSVSSARSSAVYGTDLMLDNYPDGTSTDIPGINLSLVEGDRFNYNQAVDLSDNDKNAPLIDLMYVPSGGPKTYDAQFIYITLTDAYDPNNVVTIRLYTMNYAIDNWETVAYRRDAKARVHVAAAASGQEIKAVVNSAVSTGNEGASIQTYNWAMTTDTRPFESQDVMLGEESSIQLYYDYPTHCIYASGYITTTPRLIVDLDEMTYQDAAFDGFTTGEVLISLYGGGYFKPALNTVITSIDGQRLDRDFSDVSEIEIFVDTEKYGDGELVAMVGKPFEIMPATAADVYHQDAETKVSARVYRNYYLSGAKVDVPVVNGKFVPTEKTVYTIEYSAVGYNGEVFRKTVDVTAKEFEEDGFVSSGAQENGKSGRPVPVFSVEPVSAVGKIDVKYSVYDAANKEFTVENGCFKPSKAGVYRVIANVSDYAGRNAEIIKTCKIEDGGIVLDSQPMLNDHYFTNKQYVLPVVTAYDYTKQETADVKVKVNGVIAENNVVKFTGTSAVVSYTSGDELLYEKTVGLIDAIGGEYANEFSYEKFFILSDGLTSAATDDGIKIAATENKDKVTVDFVNPLYVDNFNLILTFADSTFSGFETISFYLTDRDDRDNVLKVSFKASDVRDGKYILYLNDNRYPYQQAALGRLSDGEYKLDISYSETFSLLTVDNGFERSLKLLGYGDAFNGFASATVDLRIELENVAENAGFNVRSVCGQGVSSDKHDYVAAAVVTDGEYEAYLEHGSVLNVHRAYGVDVVSGICDAFVTVRTPSGARATSVDGTKLDTVNATGYEVLIEEYGFYLIEYTVYDSVGNYSRRLVSMVSVDRTPPEITVTFEKTTATLGETFTLPQASISDNDNGDDAQSKVYCMIVPPIGSRYIIDPGDSVTFAVRGEYVIRYYGVDASGNTVKLDFSVTVG